MSTEPEFASWTEDGFPVDLKAICAHCGWDRGSHRMMTDQCPVSEHHVEWRETKFEAKPACPKCGGLNTDRKHHNANWKAPECHYWGCENCNHQWGHE